MLSYMYNHSVVVVPESLTVDRGKKGLSFDHLPVFVLFYVYGLSDCNIGITLGI